jgi:hypothetical protein
MSAPEFDRDPALEWLDHAQPVGLVVAPTVLKTLGLEPTKQGPVETAEATALIDVDGDGPALSDPWAFVQAILGWNASQVAGVPGGPEIAPELEVRLPEHGVTLRPTWAVRELGAEGSPWQLLVQVQPPGVQPDARGALDGWEATPQQRFERLLRETGVYAGVSIWDDGIRLTYAPRGETSGHVTFPIRPLASVAGRAMLGGLKLLLGGFSLFNNPRSHRLPTVLAESREAQALVSSRLSEQVLGALFELLRGFDAAERDLTRSLAADQPGHLYEGLLTVLLRLVFILYAEDRDLLPSRTDLDAARVYESSYSVRGLYGRLVEDAALNPDTMDERRGGWGRLLALFRLVHAGHPTGFVQARRGKLFDPDAFPFLEGRSTTVEEPRVPEISDGCLLRILEGLMTLAVKGGGRERLSYRTLDVEQIGSVYETVMGFEAGLATGRSVAIKAGKNNKTPVFADLDALAGLKGKARIKAIKEESGRALSAAEAKPVEAAITVDELSAALGKFADPRGSEVAAGTPILQPTDERRRSGSHYTPRSLTAPIVRHALGPAFERIGPDARPEAVLDLKVCDPAMGSGAFLVEVCRALGERLTRAWARWPETRPAIPADEDEELHARRLVAQRCLYGVDRNPRAVDLARLSLWLATLARDHEFTFLDHALKCGDSLVGLDLKQVAATDWDRSKPPTLVGGLVRQHLVEAEKGRAQIRSHADDATDAELRPQLRAVDARLAVARSVGDGVVAAFFSSEKPKARAGELGNFRRLVMDGLGRANWHEVVEQRLALCAGFERWGRPLHWPVEFPEVFNREDPGFDAIVGNPPFAGKNTIIAGNRPGYLAWLQALHEGAHGNADLVAHFFLRAFSLLRPGGTFGLIATNTIGQGDTRATGLTTILASGGTILRATRRLKWPGEAAVIVSVVHVQKGRAGAPVLDGRLVRRISAYLVEGDLDVSPTRLAANSGKAFVGSYVLGKGFTFDDAAAAKGDAESLGRMRELIAKDRRNAELIFPYLGGEDVNTSPTHEHHRYVINFGDFPLRREVGAKTWLESTDRERDQYLRSGIVPSDYVEPVAADWPDLLEIVEHRAKPQRLKQKDKTGKQEWWRFLRRRDALYSAIAPLEHVLLTPRVSSSPNFAAVPNGVVFNEKTIVFSFSSLGPFACLQSRPHEIWLRAFTSTLKDDLNYAPSDCFMNFPFPAHFESNPSLEGIGKAYHALRARLMIERNEGLTKTYNRFHARGEKAADIAHLRNLHHEMDVTVLRAYGWDDLADAALPEFLEQPADEGKTPKTRFDWPDQLKGEVLARLLALNAERAAAEKAAGLTPTSESDDDEDEELDDEDLKGPLL